MRAHTCTCTMPHGWASMQPRERHQAKLFGLTGAKQRERTCTRTGSPGTSARRRTLERAAARARISSWLSPVASCAKRHSLPRRQPWCAHRMSAAQTRADFLQATVQCPPGASNIRTRSEASRATQAAPTHLMQRKVQALPAAGCRRRRALGRGRSGQDPRRGRRAHGRAPSGRAHPQSSPAHRTRPFQQFSLAHHISTDCLSGNAQPCRIAALCKQVI